MKKGYLLIGIILSIFLKCTTESTDSIKGTESAMFNSETENNYQTFEILGDSSTSLTCQQGTIIDFPAHAFVFEDQSSPTKPITVRVKEIFSPSEMIFNNVTTVSNGRPLESSGMIHLTATSAGKVVKLKAGVSYDIHFPSMVSKADMLLFEGVEGARGINWVVAEPPIEDTIIVQREVTRMLGYGAVETTVSLMQIVGNDTLLLPYDSTLQVNTIVRDTISSFDFTSLDTTDTAYNNQIDYFIFKSTKFGWINCDRFFSENDLVDFTVNMDSINSPLAYVVLAAYNSVLPVYKNNINLRLPNNTTATIIAIDSKNDKLYFGEEKVKIVDGQKVKVSLSEEDLDFIKKRITQL